jgi:hypothetical protein
MENIPSESNSSAPPSPPPKVNGKKRRANEEDDVRRDATPPKSKPRPRPKPKAKNKPPEDSDEEIQESQPTKAKPKVVPKANGRAASEQPKIGKQAPLSPTTGSRAKPTGKPASTGSKVTKGKGKGTVGTLGAVSEEDEDEDPKPKKKRKIGGLLGVGLSSWNDLGGDASEFGIPGGLSPVKGGTGKGNSAVPARSNFKPAKSIF